MSMSLMVDEKFDVVLAGLDVGTSSVKLLLFDERGRRLREFREPLTVRMLPGVEEAFEQDPREVYNKVIALLRQALSSLKAEVFLVGLSSTSPGLLLLDDSGEPLGGHMLWMDRRAVHEAEEISQKVGLDTVYQKTGLHVDAMFTASKILWTRRNKPELFSKARFFVQLKDYLFLKLTGQKRTDYSHISETLLFTLSGDWFHEILSYLELTPDSFFEPGNSTELYELSQEARRELDAGSTQLLVALGGVDSVCASLGLGGVDSSVLVDTTGTSTCLDLTVENPVVGGGFETYFHVIPGKYTLEACTPTSGEALKKVLSLISGADKDPDELLRRARRGPSGLIFLPFLSGSRSPDWNPELRGLLYGLSLSTKPEDIVKAVMEGVALWERAVIEKFEDLSFKVKEVRLGGGGASHNWARIKADVTGIRHMIPAEKEASAFGAAMLAGLGYGLYKSPSEVKSLVRLEKEFNPDPESLEAYSRMYRVFLELWGRVGALKLRG